VSSTFSAVPASGSMPLLSFVSPPKTLSVRCSLHHRRQDG
jgi:hypothetical protein